MPTPRLHLFAHRLLSAAVDHYLSWDSRYMGPDTIISDFTLSALDAAKLKTDDPFEQRLITLMLTGDQYVDFITEAATLLDVEPDMFLNPRKYPLADIELPPLQP